MFSKCPCANRRWELIPRPVILAAKHGKSGGLPLWAVACFAAGMTAGALVAPVGAGRTVAVTAPDAVPEVAPGPALRSGHPADVLRVLDGDTFEARVHLWPGLDVTTRVRLRGIDAPEMKARCGDERVRAEAARDALRAILDQGEVGVSRVTLDKYGGRVVADASTQATPDVSAALLGAGVARRYSGGHRDGWCP
jgi:endonuclease YncB( thermonuclease family)